MITLNEIQVQYTYLNDNIENQEEVLTDIFNVTGTDLYLVVSDHGDCFVKGTDGLLNIPPYPIEKFRIEQTGDAREYSKLEFAELLAEVTRLWGYDETIKQGWEFLKHSV